MHDDNTLARSNRIDEICDRFEQAWTSGDRRDIETVLAENPNVDRGQLLRELIRLEMELRRRSGEDPAPGEYERRFPDHGTTVGHDIDGTVLRQSTGQRRSETVDVSFHPDTETVTTGDPSGESTFLHGDSTTQPAGDTVDTGTKRFGDYELLHEIARGGMGVVYKARQTKLNRVVALKMIKAGELAGELDVQRFHAEAEAAAQLDHPGIVPIYEVGEQSGQHFFSMGLVAGEGLDTKLKDGPLPAKEAAKLIAEIAGAVQFAHDKGIVHRDLKPANVLIDTDGAPKITDFGLAKNISGDSGLTATGQVMGTPSYMPPEQAAGRVDEVGPLADVYSLGAMLYALLTGRPPFQAANVMETLQQVLERDPVSPRTLNPAVDRDLETICLKSLEKDPAKRYATAGEFADDIGRYLENKPIIARPIGKPARVWRWCKRNPLGATVVALLLFLAVAGPTVAAIQIDTNRRLDAALAGEREATATAEAKERETAAALAKVKVALANEQAALKRKDRALLETMDSIDAYVDVVRNAELLKDPRFKGLLTKLLKDALAHYRRFVQEHKDEQDESTRVRMGRAFYGIGFISYQIGNQDTGITAYREALSIRKGLAEAYPNLPEYQHELAISQHNLGLLCKESGKTAEALVAYKSALALYRKLVTGNPNDLELQRGLASSYQHLAVLYEAIDKPSEALTAYRQGLAILEMLTGKDPTNAAFRNELAMSYHNLGSLYRDHGKTAEALKKCRQALEIWKKLTREHPDITTYRSQVANGHSSLGLIYTDNDQPTEALNAHREAIKVLSDLVRVQPNVTEFQFRLASCHNRLGNIYNRSKQPTKALTAYLEAVAIRTRLARENPTVTEYQEALAASHNNLGSLYQSIGKTNEALASCRRALAIREKLSRAHPTRAEFQSELASSHSNLGYFYSQTGDMAKATAALEQAIQIRSRLVRAHPTRPDFQNGLAASLCNMGVAHLRLKQPKQAFQCFEKELAIRRKLLQKHPTHRLFRKELAFRLRQVAGSYFSAGMTSQALEYFRKAVDLNPDDPKHHIYHGIALQKLKRFDESMAALNNAIKLDPRSEWAYRNRAINYRLQGKLEEALGELDRAAGLAPEQWRVYYLRGNVLRDLQRNDEAITCFDKVLKLNPRSGWAYLYRGFTHQRKRRYKLARTDLANAFRVDPSDFRFANSLAWLLATCPDESIRNGKLAVQLATRACKMTNWKSAKCLGTLAAAHAESGDFESAVKWQKEAQRLYSPELKERWAFLLELYNSAKPYRAPIPRKPRVRAPRPARIR